MTMDPSTQFTPTPPAPAAKDSAGGTADRPEGRPDAGRVGEGRGAGDLVRAALVVALAFLLASFPARNSDAWRHLATGRAWVQGSYHLGTDPFAYTTDGVYWANPSWLADVFAYGLYETLGGAGLVVFKALLAALLAGLMLGACWRGPSRWAAALAVGLAVVAAGPYLDLRPACLSYLFLGFTFWWVGHAGRRLQAPGDARPAWRRTLTAYAPLLVVFALWSNLDEWFLLGPLTLGLAWLGMLVGPRGSRAAARGLGWVVLAGLAVCLVNPHHVHALGLPAALSASADDGLAREILGPANVLSPFQSDFWRTRLSAPLLAYYFLALLGLASFAVNFPRPRWDRALVWLALFLLSAYRGAAVPFFAVVAGPILALNVQDYVAGHQEAGRVLGPRARRVAGWAPAAALVLLAVAAVAAWPGWLQGVRPEPRRWALEGSPSLEGAAARLARWRDDGLLPAAARGLSLSPATADYLAWYRPEEKGFLDSRLGVFPREVTDDFLALRQALTRPPAGSAEGAPPVDRRAILDRRKVTHLILFDPDDERLFGGLVTVLASPREWRMVALRGRVVVFDWRAPRADSSALAKVPALDLRQRAYRPSADDVAPAEGPDRDPRPRTWQDAFTRPLPSGTVDRDEALVYLAHFEALRPARLRRNQAEWLSVLAAGTVGQAAPEFVPLALRPDFQVGRKLFDAGRKPPAQNDPGRVVTDPLDVLAIRSRARYRLLQDDGPPGSLLLSIRAARRALRAESDDARAYLVLGLAYRHLLYDTRERTAVVRDKGRLRDRVRHVQALTALNAAVLLRPDLLQAHAVLAGLYRELGYRDLELRHRVALVKLGPGAGVPEERVRAWQETAQDLDDEVQDLLRQTETESYRQKAVARAARTLEAGLPVRALQLLAGADSSTLGPEGVLLKCQLLLYVGRGDEARAGLAELPSQAEALPEFHWVRAQLAAATGDYARADDDLRALRRTGMPFLKYRNVPFRNGLAVMTGLLLLDRAARQHHPDEMDMPTYLGKVAELDRIVRAQVEFEAMRGALALEAGQVGRARELLRHAASMWQPDEVRGGGLAAHYLHVLGPAPRR
jgi:hypothetical protein